MPIINRPGRGGGGGSSTPAKALLDYEYDDTSTVVDTPGDGKFRLTDPDLTQASNTVVIDHVTKNGVNASAVLDSPPILEESLLILEGGTTGSVLVGRVTAVTVDTDFTSIAIDRMASSATFTAAETVKITYATDGNVTFNSVTGNLEVGGVSIGDPADISQQFFKYKFSSGTSVTAIPGKTIRFSNADPKSATSGWITDRIDETDIINIQNTLNLLAPGSMMFVRAKNTVHMALFQIETVTPFTEGSVNGKAFTFKSPGAVDGVQFTPDEEVYVNFFGLGNFIYNTTTKEGSVNGVQVTGQNVVADFASLPDPTDADNDNEVYKVSTPGIWVECDGVANAWKPLNGRARTYRLPTPIKITAPVTQASAIGSNGGNAQITAVGHLLTTSEQGYSVYVSGTASGNAWTPGLYQILTRDGVDTFTLNVARGTLGVPIISIANDSAKVPFLTVDNPPMTPTSSLFTKFATLVSSNADDKQIGWTLAEVDGSGGIDFYERNTTAASQAGEYVEWEIFNLGVVDSQQGASSKGGAGKVGTLSGAPVTAGLDSNLGTRSTYYAVFAAPGSGDPGGGTTANTMVINSLEVMWGD